MNVDQELQQVPEERRAAVERVRAHLVALRGGALFLGPADAVRLIGWLDAGVPVARILAALDHAAKVRFERRSRAPFTLGQVTRYLEARLSPVVDRADSAHPFGPLLVAAEGGGAPEARLRARIQFLDPNDPEVEDRATSALVDWAREAWEALPADDRERRVAGHLDVLEGLVDTIGEAAASALAEEAARSAFRRSRPRLDATTLWACLEAWHAKEEDECR